MNNPKPEGSEKLLISLMFYRILGILLLKRMIMRSIGKLVLRVNRREEMPSYFIGYPFRIESLLLTLKWSYFNEIVHLSLIFISSVIGYFFIYKGYFGGVIIMGGSILLNIGLALLQRFNRVRLHRTINALKQRKIILNQNK